MHGPHIQAHGQVAAIAAYEGLLHMLQVPGAPAPIEQVIDLLPSLGHEHIL
jgi:hypothetical protein